MIPERTPTMLIDYLIHWTGWRRFSCGEVFTSGTNVKTLTGFYMNMMFLWFECYSCFTQVRLGTERGAFVVRWAIRLLYSSLLVLGLTKILPLTCTVSQQIWDIWLKNKNIEKPLLFFVGCYSWCVSWHYQSGIGFQAMSKSTTR